uniref:serine protease FAM111A-like isoform X2 n=1 Tax=Gasterosteus aculeatus aculeatus TaxID=481459 RepID=UPI001A984A3E|nr:serine protease FAM111A-like isoform X2 [Gasterosteus aculeatus aculeatus]
MKLSRKKERKKPIVRMKKAGHLLIQKLLQSPVLNRRPQSGVRRHRLQSLTTLKWQWNGKTKNVTCNKARSVESALKESSQFREIAKKNNKKELVITRHGKAISSHFPCSLIKDELLTIKYFKAANAGPSGSDHRQKKRPSSDLVMFDLLTKGGAKVNRIMRNPELEKKDIDTITVYAYKGEKVKYALKRDGRLLDVVFKRNCALLNTNTEETTEMSDLVHDHDGEIYKIVLLNLSSPPLSQPGSLEETPTMSDPQRSDSEGNPGPPQPSATTQSVNVNTPENTAGLDGKKEPDTFHKIIHSERMLIDLFTEFKKVLKGMNSQRVPNLSRARDLLRVEYSKNDETCREVRTMKTLMQLSDSVCQVRINDRSKGSGFLLFDKFVLTNGHVAKTFYDGKTQLISPGVTVHFSFESLGQADSGAAVIEVVGFENGCDESGQKCDWALMRIVTDHKLPDGLLTHLGRLPQHGGICIIGHPGEGVKKMDPCFIIPNENRQQAAERHQRKNPHGVLPTNPHYYESAENIQLITQRFFNDVKKDNEFRQALHYDTCFGFGSSGSPVFDTDCNVVAMHTGGYAYRNAKKEMHSVIEYGCPLSTVIDHFIVQMVEKGKADVLKQFLACCHEQHQPEMMASLKQLVEKNENSYKFSELFSQEEASVPMDED